MKTTRFSDNQMMQILKLAEADTLVPTLCREHGMSIARAGRRETSA